MNFQEITEKIQGMAAQKGGVGKSIKFNTPDGFITIAADGSVTNSDDESDCTIGVDTSDLSKMMTGDLNPMSAFMFGKLKISGDMSVAMQLQNLF